MFFDGEVYWLAVGFHRFYGARDAGKNNIIANIHDGNKRDAVMVKKLRRTQIAVKTLDLRLTRVSHLRRLISPLGTGNWRFSAPNMPLLLQPWHILLAALSGMV
ncbi:MAG: hypothetical protein ABGZ24_13805, partial [Fuerstiella sp.]